MRFVRGLWRVAVGVKDALVLLAMLLFFGLLFAALSLSPNPRAPGGGALVVELDGALVEQPAEADPFATLAGAGPALKEHRLRDVVRAIRGAAGDASVKAVVLDLDRFTGGGQAAVATVGSALDRVRAAGKPVLAYSTRYTDDDYQLAAHASEVWLDPAGAVLLTGPGGPRLYYKGLLDKLGVTANVYRVGTYKAAVEPFIRRDQSPEAREANQALADALWATWRQDVRRARPRAQLAAYTAQPQAWLARAGGDMAEAARAARMVDRIGDRSTFEARVAALAGGSTDTDGPRYQAIPYSRWLAGHPAARSGDAIGVVTIAGDIVDGDWAPGTAGGDTIADLVHDAVRQKKIKALVVRVDSPGGSVTASERMRAAILGAKRAGLPVAVSMGNYAASGGYWVATPADRIFAEPATVTGSIGVFGLIPTFAGTLERLGLSADGVATTPLSGQPDLFRGTSPQFDRLFQLSVEGTYRRFTALVAQSRGLPVARVDAIGQGRVWPGTVARRLGLVDELGGVDAAVAWAARAAKLDPAKVHPRYIEREPSSLKAFFRDLWRDEGGEVPRDAWTAVAARPERIVAEALRDARRIAAGPAIQARCLECPGGVSLPREAGLARLLLARLGL